MKIQKEIIKIKAKRKIYSWWHKTKVLSTKAYQYILVKSKILIADRRFRIGLLLVLLLAIAFLSGMKLQSYFDTLPSNTTINANNGSGVKPTTERVVSTKEVVRGKIKEINLPTIKVDSITGEVLELDVVSKSVLLSSTSKSISGTDLKVGDNTLIYTSKDANGRTNIDRLRITE